VKNGFGYRILVEWDERDGVYVARVPAIRACSAHGDSPALAARNAQAAAAAMLAVLREDGDTLPPPDAAASYSGNIRLRLPASLHRRLDERAGADGVSLNTLMVSLLSQGLAGSAPGATARRWTPDGGPASAPRAAEPEARYRARRKRR
jgi:antitoxin HicB